MFLLGGFIGYVELFENVFLGDYFVVYYGGKLMSVVFVGNSKWFIIGDEVFECVSDEVGIYKVYDVDIDFVDIFEVDFDEEVDDVMGVIVGGVVLVDDEIDVIDLFEELEFELVVFDELGVIIVVDEIVFEFVGGDGDDDGDSDDGEFVDSELVMVDVLVDEELDFVVVVVDVIVDDVELVVLMSFDDELIEMGFGLFVILGGLWFLELIEVVVLIMSWFVLEELWLLIGEGLVVIDVL